MTVITLSRQYGSGGDEVACRVCELLGYRLFDKQMMARIASEAGLSAKDVVDAQEDRHQALGFFERVLGHKVAEARISRDESGERIVEIGELDSKRFVTLVRSLIDTAYQQGDVVIVGRGSQAALRGKPGVLHVRLEAPFEERVRRVDEQQRFRNPAQARAFVEGRDAAAADYVRSYYNVDWADPDLYHLVLNTGLWEIESAGQVIANAIQYIK